MTLAKLLALVDDNKPNEYSDELKTLWLNEVEFRAHDEVWSRAKGNSGDYVPLNYLTDPERELLIPDQFADAYRAYLYAKIDYTNGEFERYNNDSALYDAAFNSYAAWYRRNHNPKSYEIAVCYAESI